MIILHENPASLVSKGVMFRNYWGWNIKDMIFFQELWGYVSGLLSSGVSLSTESFAFRKLNFKSVRAMSWLIRAIQAVTNATSVSVLSHAESDISISYDHWNLRSVLKPSPTSLKSQDTLNIFRNIFGTTKSMTSLLQYSVVEVWLFLEKK